VKPKKDLITLDWDGGGTGELRCDELGKCQPGQWAETMNQNRLGEPYIFGRCPHGREGERTGDGAWSEQLA